MKIKEIFGEKRIVGLAGERNEGKTNNLIALVKEFRTHNKKTPIYFYGFNENTLKYVLKFPQTFEISSIEQLSNKKDSLIILDEFQRLRLNDRRDKELLEDFINFIFHNNNWVIFSTPDVREFNSIIGSKIERWVLKSIRLSNVINGSQLKSVIIDYNGRYKSINDLVIPKNKMLIINQDFEKEIEVEYIKEIDSKEKNEDIFRL